MLREKHYIVILVSSLILTSGGMVPTSSQQGLHLVATTDVVGDIVSNIVGTRGTVDVLMTKGVDPHEFQPTTSDSEKIQSADHVFYIGRGVEEVLADTLDGLQDVGRATSLIDLLEPEDLISSQGGINPHFWLNPLLVEKIIDDLADVLLRLDPQGESMYRENAEQYRGELIELDAETLNLTASVPEGKRFLVTQHDAFVYWADRYGFVSRALEGVSTADQVSLKEIDELARYMKDNEIEVIFLETTVPDTQVQALIDSTDAIGWSVKPGGTLYSGSLGDGSASTYIGMMRANAETIVEGILNPPSGVGSKETPLSIVPVLVALALFVMVKRNGRRMYRYE